MTLNQELFAKGMEYYDDSECWNALPLLKEAADSGNLLAAEKPTFTFKLYGGCPRWTDDVTVGSE